MMTFYSKILNRLLILVMVFVTYQSDAQNGIGIKYLRDYIQKASPKVGVVYSYDSITSESSLAAISSGEAFMTAILVSGNKEMASRNAFAYYEAMTTPALSKIKNLNNITYTDHNDNILHSSSTHGEISKKMEETGVDLLFHIVFDPVFFTRNLEKGPGNSEVQVILNFDITCKVYSRTAANPRQPYYFEMPLYYMSYNITEEEKRRKQSVTAQTTKAPTISEIQQGLATEHLRNYADRLVALKSALEGSSNAGPVGIIRSVDADQKRIVMESRIPVAGVSGFSRTMGDIQSAYHGSPKGPIFGLYGESRSITDGLVIASVAGDNPTTSFITEESYEIPIAELVVREGEMNAAICKINKLPKELSLEDLVGMKVIAATDAGSYLINPLLEKDVSMINKSPSDDSFLQEKRMDVMETVEAKVKEEGNEKKSKFARLKEQMQKDAQDGNTSQAEMAQASLNLLGPILPSDGYKQNPLVFPETTIEADKSEFKVEGVKRLSETIDGLKSKGYKVGIVFNPQRTQLMKYGVLEYFTKQDVLNFVTAAKEIGPYVKKEPEPNSATTSPQMRFGNQTKELTPEEELVKLNLANTTSVVITSSGPESELLKLGQHTVKRLNEEYDTDIFELINPTPFPTGERARRPYLDFPKTQYKLMGGYELIVTDSKITSALNLFYSHKKGGYKRIGGMMFTGMLANYEIPDEFTTEDYEEFTEVQDSGLAKSVAKYK